jgi:hypothetical protein
MNVLISLDFDEVLARAKRDATLPKSHDERAEVS